MNSKSLDEKRDCVRAALCADVQFSIMDLHEYEAVRKGDDVRFGGPFANSTKRMIPDGEEEKTPGVGALDPNLVDFLIQIDEKLDLILKLFSKGEKGDESFFVGEGVDIGGGGMSLLSEKEVEFGQILHLKFRIFRYPIVSLQVFGKVVRAGQSTKDGRSLHEVGLEFFDLDEDCKEWIISYVFQIQREAIRRQKRG